MAIFIVSLEDKMQIVGVGDAKGGIMKRREWLRGLFSLGENKKKN